MLENTNTIPQTLGERIVTARKLRGIKQKDLARNIGVSPTALNYYEKNKREPNMDTIVDISYELDVTIDYLMGIESIDAHTHQKLMREGRYRELEKQLGIPENSIGQPDGTHLIEEGDDYILVPVTYGVDKGIVDEEQLPRVSSSTYSNYLNGTASEEEKRQVDELLKVAALYMAKRSLKFVDEELTKTESYVAKRQQKTDEYIKENFPELGDVVESEDELAYYLRRMEAIKKIEKDSPGLLDSYSKLSVESQKQILELIDLYLLKEGKDKDVDK